MNPKKVMLIAGEASGDLQGAHLVEAIQRIDPEVRFWGIGGDCLEGKGMNLLYHARFLSVVGITEVFLKLGSILKAFRALKRSLDRDKPDLVILIDFPDFNLRFAKVAHRKGIPILYYISPQVWAWRPRRVDSIARWVKKMIVFFPFEVPLYEAAGVDVEWVGHPLLDMVKPSLSAEAAVQQFGLDPRRRTVALLPGSRMHEVSRLLPPLLACAHLLEKEIPDLQFILPLAPGIPRVALGPLMKKTSVAVKIIEGWTYDVMNVSELLISASGTATLEAAILGKPMVIVYKVSLPSYWIGRLLVHVDHVGLVNLVARERIAPELLQGDANPQKMAEESLRILRDPVLRHRIEEAMTKVRQALGEPGAAQRAARIVWSMLTGEGLRKSLQSATGKL